MDILSKLQQLKESAPKEAAPVEAVPAPTSFTDAYRYPKHFKCVINPDSFKIRASAAHQLMTEPRTKAEKEAGALSKTAQSYLKLWYKEKVYGRHRELHSKYIAKGNDSEAEALAFAASYLGYGKLSKNQERKQDLFKTGECDAVAPDCIIDIKCSWDFSTFPLLDTVPDKAYYAQGQVYMDLWGVDRFKLVYVLVDTPLHIVESEFYRFCHKEGIEPSQEAYDHIRNKHVYGHLPHDTRIKVFEFGCEQAFVTKLNDRVLAAREFLKSTKL